MELFYRFVWTHYTLETLLEFEIEKNNIDEEEKNENDNNNDDKDDEAEEENDDDDNDDQAEDDDDDDDDDDNDEDESDDDDDDDLDDTTIINDIDTSELSHSTNDSLPNDASQVIDLAVDRNLNGMALLAKFDRRFRRRTQLDSSTSSAYQPERVALFFNHPSITAACDECEANVFAAVDAAHDQLSASDAVWQLPFDITPALDALVNIALTRADAFYSVQLANNNNNNNNNNNDEEKKTFDSIKHDVYTLLSTEFQQFFENIGISLHLTSMSNGVQLSWHEHTVSFARNIYSAQFRNLTRDGTVASSSNFCTLFPDLLLLADSKTDSCLAKVFFFLRFFKTIFQH